MYSEDPEVNRKAAISLTETVAHLHNLTQKTPSLAGQPRGDIIQFLGWLKNQYQTFQQFEQALAQFQYPAPVQETVTATFARLDTYYHLIYEAQSRLRIVSIPVSQDLGDDHACSIDTKMKLLPGALAAATMLYGGPFTLADDG